MKTLQFPKQEIPLRLINWSNVTTVEQDPNSEGVFIYFVDGRRVKSPLTMREAQEAINIYWRR